MIFKHNHRNAAEVVFWAFAALTVALSVAAFLSAPDKMPVMPMLVPLVMFVPLTRAARYEVGENALKVKSPWVFVTALAFSQITGVRKIGANSVDIDYFVTWKSGKIWKRHVKIHPKNVDEFIGELNAKIELTKERGAINVV